MADSKLDGAARVLRVVFVRHAESANNVLPDGDPTRVADPHLTPLGMKQAAAAGARIAAQVTGLSVVLSSPMIRALQTAKVMCQAIRGAKPEVWVGLHEVGGLVENDSALSLGTPVPGLGRREMCELVPGLTVPSEVSDVGWFVTDRPEALSNAEQRAETISKKLRALAKKTDASAPTAVAVVSHGDFLNLLLQALLLGNTKGLVNFDFSNCSLSIVDLHASGEIDVVCINSATTVA